MVRERNSARLAQGDREESMKTMTRDIVGKYVKVGSIIGKVLYIDGRMACIEYEDDDGNTRTMWEVAAHLID